MRRKAVFKLATCQLFTFLYCLILASAHAGLDAPHDVSTGTGCLSCHQMNSTYLKLLPPLNHTPLPGDIDDTTSNGLCWGCHNDPMPLECGECHPSSSAPYVATHSSLTTDNGYGDWTVECWVCHNQHMQEQKYNGSTYGKYIRRSINLANIKGADGNTLPGKSGSKTVKFFGPNGPDSFAHNDRLGIEWSDSTPDGICQVCHELTRHWKNDGTAAGEGVHAKYNGNQCMWCHNHANGFKTDFPDHGIRITDAPFCLTCHPGPQVVDDTHAGDCGKCHDASDYSMQPYLSLYQDDPLVTPVNCDECHYGQFAEHIVDTGYGKIHNKIVLGYDTDDNGASDEILSCDACHVADLVQEHSTRRKVSCTICHDSSSAKVQAAISQGRSIADGGLEQFVFCDDCHNANAGAPSGNLIANHHLTPYSTAGMCTKCHVVGPGKRGPEKMPCFFCHGDSKPMDPKRAGINKHEFGPTIPVVTAEEIKKGVGIKDFRLCFSCHLDGGQGYKQDLYGSLPPLVAPMHGLPSGNVYWPTGYYKDASNNWVAHDPLIPSNTDKVMPASLDQDSRLFTPEPVQTTTWGKYPGFGNINYLAEEEYRSAKYHVGGVVEAWLNERPDSEEGTPDGEDYWGPLPLVIDMLMMDFPKVPISYGGYFEVPSYDGRGYRGKPTASNGSLSVTIEPPEAVTAGARWRLDGGDWQVSGDSVSGISERKDHLVEFKPLAGWDEPSSLVIETTNSLTTVNGAQATYNGCGAVGNEKLTITRATGTDFTWNLPDQQELLEVSDNHPGAVSCEVWLDNAGDLAEAEGFVVTPTADGKNCVLSKDGVTPEGVYDLVVKVKGSSCFQNFSELQLAVNVTADGAPSPVAQAGGMVSGPIDSIALSGRGTFLRLQGNLFVHNNNGNLSTFTIDENGNFGPILDTATVHSGSMTRISDTIVAIVYTETVNGPYESNITTIEILPDGTITGVKQNWVFHSWGIFAAVASTMYPHGTRDDIFIVSWRSANTSESILTVRIDPVTGIMTPIDMVNNYTGSSNEYFLTHVSGEFYTMLLGSKLVTLQIGADGTIINPYAGTFTIGEGGYGEIIHLQGDVYALVSSGPNSPGHLYTLEIKVEGGTLTYRLINKFMFEPCSSGYYSGPGITKITDNVVGIHYFEYTGCSDPYSSSMLQTFEISDDGRITVPRLDVYELAGTYGTNAPVLRHIHNDIFAYAVQVDKSGDTGVNPFTGIKTIRISMDGDNDGKPGGQDNCPDVSNPGQQDSDGDGIGDACDPCPNDPDNDLDHDGVCGNLDECPGEAKDDKDGDGICDGSGFHGDKNGDNDNCPFTSNPDQADTDGDGLGDACDPCPGDADNDLDGDVICGNVDPCPLDAQNDRDNDGVCADQDNCPNDANPDQLDSDGDMLGDVCDPEPFIPAPGIDKDCDLQADLTKPPVYYPPATLQATSSSGTSMVLSWGDAMFGEKGYRIERKAESCTPDTLSFEPVTTVLHHDGFAGGIDPTAWVPVGRILEGEDRDMPISISGASGLAEVSWENEAVKFHTIANDVDNDGYNVSFLQPKDFAGLFGNTDFDLQFDYSYSLTNPAATNYHTYARLDSYFPVTTGANSIYVSRQKDKYYTGIQINGEPWEGGSLSTTDTGGKLRLIRKNRRLAGYTWDGIGWYRLHEHSKPLSTDAPPVWIGAVHHLNRNETGGQEITTYVDNFVFNTAGGLPVAALSMDFDEAPWTGADREVYDAAVDGNHGTARAGATTFRDNQRGAVASFDGIDDFVEIPGNGTLENMTDSSFSFAAWARPMSVPLKKDANPPANDWRYTILGRPGWHTNLSYNPNKKFVFEIWNDSSTYFAVASPAFEPGQWHHLVGSVDDEAKTIRLYVDGQLVSTGTYTGNLRDYGTKSYFIGTSNHDVSSYMWFFHGLIDDVRIFDRAISTKDVQALSNNGKQYTDTGLDAGTTYCYRIYPFKENGCNNWENHAAEIEISTTGSCTDTDGDNACDNLDICPGDAYDDPDGDGFCAGAGFNAPKVGDNDNCPFLANPNQEDVDGNGVGDACYINQPWNVSPLAGTTGVSWNPALHSSSYFSSSGGAHQASQWQISTADGAAFAANIVYDSSPVADLVNHSATATLEGNTVYYWHVRYQDDQGYWSWYSPATSFTTAVGVPASVAVAQWKFEEGSGVTVLDSIGTNDGVLQNGLNSNWTTGVAGGGMSFDGTNDYVEVPSISGFNEFSAEMWVKPDYGNDGVNHTLLDLSDVYYRESFDSAGLQEVFECAGALSADEGRFYQTCDPDGDDYIHITNTLAFSGGNSLRARTTRLPAPNNGCPMSGAYMNFARPITITGDLIFDARAYGIIAQGNIIRLDINNDSGNARSIYYGVNVALPWQYPTNDTATVKHFELNLPTNAWGNVHRNIRSDMTSKGWAVDPTDRLTAIWVAVYCGAGIGTTQDLYVDDLTVYRETTQHKDSSVKLVKSNDNYLNLLIKDKLYRISNEKVVQDTWNHVAFTVSPTSISMYVNGVGEVVNQSLSYNFPATLTPFLGGNQILKSFYDGTLDEVILHNRALTPEEVQGRYVAGGKLITGVVPDQPTNLSPLAGATDVPTVRPTLSASSFVDGDSGDTHQGSRWQIRKATGVFGDGDSYDSGVIGGSSTHTVSTDLATNTLYSWRVQYQDSQGGWSVWSGETSFTIGNSSP